MESLGGTCARGLTVTMEGRGVGVAKDVAAKRELQLDRWGYGRIMCRDVLLFVMLGRGSGGRGKGRRDQKSCRI